MNPLATRDFINWARTIRVRPRAWHRPASEAELASVIQRTSGRLKVVGAGHSWSSIAAPEEDALDLDLLSGLVRVAGDQVTVHAGTRLHQLNALLAAPGLALPIVGSVAQQSLAGAIATATHGSSLHHGNLSSLVRHVRLCDARGELHDLHDGDERLDGARVHLGVLGALTQVTLQVGPAFDLRETAEDVPLGRLDLPAVAASAEYVKVWWMPHTRSVQVIRHERSTARRHLWPPLVRRLDDRLHATLYPAVLRLGGVPGFTRLFNRVAARSFIRPSWVGPSALMLSTPMPARHRETEAAVPLARANEAFARVLELTRRHLVNFLFELRFVPGDGGWLSPAHGGPVCQLGAYCHGPATDGFFADFWRALAGLSPRPHWGKELTVPPRLEALWPRARDFLRLREQLDPGRRFAWSLLDQSVTAAKPGDST